MDVSSVLEMPGYQMPADAYRLLRELRDQLFLLSMVVAVSAPEENAIPLSIPRHMASTFIERIAMEVEQVLDIIKLPKR